MTWDGHHSESEKLASDASTASRSGNAPLAEELYRLAAAEEAAAFTDLPQGKARTRGITAVSSVALSYKGRDYATAAHLAHGYLAGGALPSFAEAQLRDLLQAIWTAESAEKAGVRFFPGDVLVSIKGGQVIHGGAPLDLIVQKVEGIQSILFRTVEMLLQKPLRRRGAPPADIQSMFQPWLFQAPAGSYQFAVRMREPEQRNLWEEDRLKAGHVTTTFLKVLQASAEDPEAALPAVVPNNEYRGVFLSLSRNLAPTGKRFERLEVRDASSPDEPAITLAAGTRRELSTALRKLRPAGEGEAPEHSVAITGILRALHLDRDWLEIATTETAPQHIRIDGAGDALDDVVGPMVNRRVVVTAVLHGKKHVYRDITLDE